MNRLGIFGGTFDPPHVGHLILATEAQYQLHLDRVLWVLTPWPPHKAGQPITPVEERFELLCASLDGNPDFELSRVDLDRKPPHYAVDTVELLHKAYPSAELVYLMGGDSLRDLPTWHTPQAFVRACDEIGVMERPGRAFNLPELEQILPGLSERVRFIEAPLLEISSTRLRGRIADGEPCRYYFLPAVYRLIEERRLYRNS
jgi:nicotinate-nucleotide adenylyltransferase